jgi:hypothetical protein
VVSGRLGALVRFSTGWLGSVGVELDSASSIAIAHRCVPLSIYNSSLSSYSI